MSKKIKVVVAFVVALTRTMKGIQYGQRRNQVCCESVERAYGDRKDSYENNLWKDV